MLKKKILKPKQNPGDKPTVQQGVGRGGGGGGLVIGGGSSQTAAVLSLRVKAPLNSSVF